jgi:hypothetical protein
MRTYWIRRHKAYRHHRRKSDHNGIMWGAVVVVVIVTGFLLWRYHGAL